MDFSLILPCYNEAEHILGSIERIIKTLDHAKYSYEIIIIDDKSSDNTRALIKNIQKKYGNIRVYFHSKNQGRGATVADGILKAKANIVGYIDFDLEVAPVYIPQMISLIKNEVADVVIGRRYYPFELLPVGSLFRNILGGGYHWLVKTVIGFSIEDTEAGYKFFNKNKILPVLKCVQNKKWFWDTEIVLRSHLAGLRIKEIPVLFLRRIDKTSTVKIIPDTLEYLSSLIKLLNKIRKEYTNNLGILYNFPKLYKYTIKILFGKNYPKRYQEIAKNISCNSSVVDVCCGDAELSNYLKHKNIDYLGIDVNKNFVIHNLRKGIRTSLADITKKTVPQGDYLVIQGSLYQFSDPKKIIRKLYTSAKKCLIVSESIQHLANHVLIKKTFLKKVSNVLVGTNNPDKNYRFDEKSLRELLDKYKPKYFKIHGGRALVAVIKK